MYACHHAQIHQTSQEHLSINHRSLVTSYTAGYNHSHLQDHFLTAMQPTTPPPQELDEMLDKMYEHIAKLKARAARAPPTPSGSSVTEPDSDPDKDDSGTVSFLCSHTTYSD